MVEEAAQKEFVKKDEQECEEEIPVHVKEKSVLDVFLTSQYYAGIFEETKRIDKEIKVNNDELEYERE